ncbi:SGNH/GDSL hydrolase family protein [Nocardioides sp. GY 10113]|uniref:SGNH/GDSL hydrolase family protein n=1 Tax=Nocardioides sp. GY 10113 TaxID=2569761 RepID=UPI0010A8F2D7|nr:SGNH/GDSL hydrolase family protein [Nocardioides sp. GY 10113]TIC85077.1 SGNH/GDSL hydrolase family protein [Nocardioides sp. GY 10113]
MRSPSRVAVVAALAAVLPLLLLARVPVGAAAPQGHGPVHRVDYDVLGDSYGSGYGVPPYAPSSSTCSRSQSAYGVLVDGRATLSLDDFVACAGATTVSLVGGGQLDALDDDTDLVLLSIGGNDTGWGTAVAACVLGSDPQCATASAAVLGVITGRLPGLLDGLYAQIAAAAPDARVLVTGYVHLFSPEYGDYLGVSVDEQETLNAGADTLAEVMRAAAERHGFEFVDVRSRFDGHGVNAPDPWVIGWGEPGVFHPNLKGYRAYAAAVTSAVRPGLHR